MIGRFGAALTRFARGETPLVDAFWNWAFFGGVAVNLSSSVLFLWLITVEQPTLALIAGYAYSVPYNLLVVIGVWRSASRFDGDPRWAEAARWITLGAMAILTIT